MHKPDIAFRTASGTYHAAITPASPAGAVVERVFTPAPPRIAAPFTLPPRTEPPFALPPRAEPEPVIRPREEQRATTPAARPAPPPPPIDEPPALTASDLDLIARIERDRAEETLRARIHEEERRRLGVDETTAEDDAATTWAMRYRPQAAGGEEGSAEGGGLSFGGLLWRMRFAIIGILLVGAGAYGFIAIRTGTAPTVAGAQPYTFVGVGSKFSGTRWDWVVNGVQRVNEAGKVRAQGVFYVVRVGATNKATDGAQLAPNDFTLIDANGVEHVASGLGGGVYQNADNPGSPNIWPASFPAGKTVTFNVVFDIDPSLPRGMSLGIADTPRTRVHLD